MSCSVEYQGKFISIYRLGKMSGCPLTSLYRAYHNGCSTGEEIIKEARKHLIEHDGQWITLHRLCKLTKSDYRSVKRRLDAGIDKNKAVADLKDRRGNTRAAKLSPSEVLNIYALIFMKEKSQTTIAKEFGIDPSTVSDIWRHKHWGWLTAPLRYELESVCNDCK